jgi:hypothetical protein
VLNVGETVIAECAGVEHVIFYLLVETRVTAKALIHFLSPILSSSCSCIQASMTAQSVSSSLLFIGSISVSNLVVVLEHTSSTHSVETLCG